MPAILLCGKSHKSIFHLFNIPPFSEALCLIVKASCRMRSQRLCHPVLSENKRDMKKTLQQLFLCLLLIATGIVSAEANDLIIASGSSVASIVIGVNATETEKYAAVEVQRCIRIMSGTELPIVPADGAVSGTQIIIGTPAGNSRIDAVKLRLHLDGSHDEQTAVLREGNIIYIGGQTARAALYATYTFLSDVLGIRWLWPGEDGEFIPKRSVVSVAELSIFEVPSIRTRALTNANSADPETGTWQARNKMNMIAINKNADGNSPAIQELAKKGFQIRIAGHFVVLPESILSANPEYAAFRDGSRAYNSANTAQLCWGNAGVQDEVANMIRGLWDKSPVVDVIHFYPADNQSYCTDDLCKAMAPDVSTRWQKFSQIVMEKVDQTHPDKRYWTYAYQGYKDVPNYVAPRFETIGYALYEASYRQLLSSGFSGSAGAIAEIGGWKSKGANMGIRGYEYIMFRDPMFVPLVSWEMDQMSWLRDEGLTAYLSELRPFNSPSGAAPENTYWMCNRMNLYAAAKGLWNSSLTPDSIVNDWSRTVYGPAADEMIDYYWDIEQLWRNASGDIQEYNSTPASQVNNVFTGEDFVRLNGYFTRARTKLSSVSADVRNRIASQIDLESRMLANWQEVANYANNRAARFEMVVESAETVDQATWNSVLKLPAFEDASGEAVDEQTIVSKLWTATDLHLRLVCQDDNIASRIANAAADDDVAILADDNIELYIQPHPDNASYLHFAVNTTGKKYDAYSAYGGTNFDISWDPEWTTATSVGANSWTVDIKIPFSALGINASENSQFKIAVKRSRGGRAENSGWPDASYFNPGSFGVATLVSKVADPVANRIILVDQGGTGSTNVSTELQERGWQVVSGVSGEEELREKLEDDAAVLILRYSSTSVLFNNEFYLNEVTSYLNKGRMVVVTTARDIPIDEWFPETPPVQWTGNSKNLSGARATYFAAGAWQTYPNDIRTDIRNRPTPVTAYDVEGDGWRILMKMPMKDGNDHPFLLTKRVGKGLLVLTSSNMGYSGGYEMFGSRNITNAVRLIENLNAELKASLETTKREQTIHFEAIPVKILGEPDFDVAATSDSGLPVTLTSSNPDVAVITDGLVEITGIGTTTITASQEGNDMYEPAERVSRTLVVEPDTEAPTVPEALSAVATDSTVTLSWNASYDFIGVHAYEILVDGQLFNTSRLTTFRVNKLRSSVEYIFEVVAVDAAGNRSDAAVLSVTTPDTQAPSQILSLIADKTNKHKVALLWEAGIDNVGVVGYDIYQNGVILNTSPVTGTTFLVERPIGKDVFGFTVTARDAAGNVSAPSNTAISANGIIKTETGEQFIIYPNPSQGAFKVKVVSEENGAVAVSIFNNSGFLIHRISDVKDTAEQEFSIQGLNAGTYIIWVTINEFSESQTIIIK